MKILLGIAAVLLIAISLYADYRWKRWLASRSQQHDTDLRA